MLDLFRGELSADEEKLGEFVEELRGFFGELRPEAKRMQTTAQYELLAGIADEWQTLLTTRLRYPLDVWSEIGFELPTENLKASRRPLTPEEIRRRLGTRAAEIAQSRKLIRLYDQIDYLNWLKEHPEILHHQCSTTEEMEQDWYSARLLLAADTLTGKIRLEDQFPTEAFAELSSCWLEDVKRVMAYFRWLEASHQSAARRVGDGSLQTEEQFYFEVCDELHRSVTDDSSKAQAESFDRIAEWVRREFLNQDKLRVEDGSPAHRLIARKAYRIWQRTGRDQGDVNWSEATRFVRNFYENIVPAVVKRRPKSQEAVLHALSPSYPPGEGSELVDALEAAIVIEYLPTDSLRECSLPSGRYL